MGVVRGMVEPVCGMVGVYGCGSWYGRACSWQGKRCMGVIYGMVGSVHGMVEIYRYGSWYGRGIYS